MWSYLHYSLLGPTVSKMIYRKVQTMVVVVTSWESPGCILSLPIMECGREALQDLLPPT